LYDLVNEAKVEIELDEEPPLVSRHVS